MGFASRASSASLSILNHLQFLISRSMPMPIMTTQTKKI